MKGLFCVFVPVGACVCAHICGGYSSAWVLFLRCQTPFYSNFLFCIYLFYVCTLMCHGMWVEVRGQLEGVGSFSTM